MLTHRQNYNTALKHVSKKYNEDDVIIRGRVKLANHLRKKVHFDEAVQVIFIPSRHELEMIRHLQSLSDHLNMLIRHYMQN